MASDSPLPAYLAESVDARLAQLQDLLGAPVEITSTLRVYPDMTGSAGDFQPPPIKWDMSLGFHALAVRHSAYIIFFAKYGADDLIAAIRKSEYSKWFAPQPDEVYCQVLPEVYSWCVLRVPASWMSTPGSPSAWPPECREIVLRAPDAASAIVPANKSAPRSRVYYDGPAIVRAHGESDDEWFKPSRVRTPLIVPTECLHSECIFVEEKAFYEYGLPFKGGVYNEYCIMRDSAAPRYEMAIELPGWTEEGIPPICERPPSPLYERLPKIARDAYATQKLFYKRFYHGSLEEFAPLTPTLKMVVLGEEVVLVWAECKRAELQAAVCESCLQKFFTTNHVAESNGIAWAMVGVTPMRTDTNMFKYEIAGQFRVLEERPDVKAVEDALHRVGPLPSDLSDARKLMLECRARKVAKAKEAIDLAFHNNSELFWMRYDEIALRFARDSHTISCILRSIDSVASA